MPHNSITVVSIDYQSIPSLGNVVLGFSSVGIAKSQTSTFTAVSIDQLLNTRQHKLIVIDCSKCKLKRPEAFVTRFETHYVSASGQGRSSHS